MLSVTKTEQEKKDMAVIYGFLVDVWSVQQSKTAASAAALKQGKRKARINKST